MKNFVEIKKEIEKIMLGYKDGKELTHANGTLNWVLKIKPDADETMQISAFTHDIERCLIPKEKSSDYLITEDIDKYKLLKRDHARVGAEEMKKILKEYDVEENDIEMIEYLIANHEDGGSEEANILRDADSLSYFEDNFSGYLQKFGPERAKAKVDYMFGRISEERKYLALGLYQDALEKIKKFNN